MSQSKEHVGERLLGDTVLMNKLGANHSWVNPTASPDKKYSVIPASKGPLAVGPYLTVTEIADNRVGTHLTESFIVIRCYNSIDKTYVEIDDVLARVKALLHNNRFTFDDDTNVIDVYYETTGSELEDEGYNQNFREAQYRVQYL